MTVTVQGDALVVSDKKLMEFGMEYTEYEILDDRPAGFHRFFESVVDSDGIRWTLAWVQVDPSRLEAFAWSTDPRRHLRAKNKDAAKTARGIAFE